MTCIHRCKLEYKIEAYDWVKTILTINFGFCDLVINITYANGNIFIHFPVFHNLKTMYIFQIDYIIQIIGVKEALSKCTNPI